MERPVVDRGAEVHHRIAGQVAAPPGVLDALLDGWHELPRDGAPENLVHELEVLAPRERLDANLAVAELAVSAGLFLVPAVGIRWHRDRLAIRNARELERDLDAEAPSQLGDGDLDVQLALAREQRLLRLRIAAVVDGGILLPEPVQRRADLLFVAARLRFDGVGEHGLGEHQLREGEGRLLVGERVAALRLLELGHRTQVAGFDLWNRRVRLALQGEQVSEPLLRVAGDVVDRRILSERAGDDAEQA